jgi:hypothetical protein
MLPSERWPVLDGQARAALRSITDREPVSAMLYRQTRLESVLVALGAVNRLDRSFRLHAGRFPRACTPTRCEVLQVGDSRAPSLPGLPRVGTGSPVSGSPIAELFRRETSRGPVVLVAEGVEGAAALPRFESSFRAYIWRVPLSEADLRFRHLDDFSSRVTRATSTLRGRSSLFDLTAPIEALKVVREAAHISGRRLLIVGGECAALVLAFAFLVASRLRPDAAAVRRRLALLGASRWQALLVSTAERAAIASAATIAGWALGGAASASVLARRLGRPATEIFEDSVLSREGVALIGALSLVATIVMLAALGPSRVRVRGRHVSIADVIAGGAIAAIALAFARGDVDPEALAEDEGTGFVLLVLPGLFTLAAAIAFARILPSALRLLGRLGRESTVPFRLAGLSLVRNPGAAIAVAAVLLASVAFAFFAESYRSTLVGSQRDQAAFAVPFDFTLREGMTGRRLPAGALPIPSRYDAAAVIRLSGEARTANGTTGLTLLGIPTRSLPDLPARRDDFSREPLDELVARIRPNRRVELKGPSLPPDARELRLPAAIRGDRVALVAHIRTAQGGFVAVDLGEAEGGKQMLRTALPAAARGGTLAALSVGFAAEEAFIASHRAAEDEAAPEVFSIGALTLGRPRVLGARGERPLQNDYRDWTGPRGSPAKRADSVVVRYVLTRSVGFLLRPRQPTDGRAIPVLASPRLAASVDATGVLPLTVRGESVNATVVGTARWFPSAGAEFVVADESWLETVLNAQAPGLGVPTELWIHAPPEAETALRRPPLDQLELVSRQRVEAQLRGDPLARGTLALLSVTAIIALGLALIGLALTIVTDLRDESGQFFDLEAQGADPAMLRRHLQLRASTVALAGLLAGLLTGGVLSRIVVDVVTVGANATSPLPPLRLELDWLVVGAALACYAALSLAIIAFVTRSAFREPAPEEGRWGR